MKAKKKTEKLEHQLQSIIDRLSAEEVGQLEEIIDMAYEKGSKDEEEPYY